MLESIVCVYAMPFKNLELWHTLVLIHNSFHICSVSQLKYLLKVSSWSLCYDSLKTLTTFIQKPNK